jgi:TPP-dependent pyruvate/acetoin dehydrogenase alpha subunit
MTSIGKEKKGMASSRSGKTPEVGPSHGIPAARLFTEGKVHGTAHFCIGEEATGIAVCAALKPEDRITATHRGHGQSIGKGMRLDLMMAEFLGKETGCCKGRGGCMHIADFAAGSLGANGIVGGGIPIAVGAALSQRFQGSSSITVCFFGDGRGRTAFAEPRVLGLPRAGTEGRHPLDSL